MMSERDRLALTYFGAKVIADLKSAGFRVAVVETGGGCTAIEAWVDDDDWSALITDGDMSHKITARKCLVVSTTNPDRVDYTTILDAKESNSGVRLNDVVKALAVDYITYTKHTETPFDRERV